MSVKLVNDDSLTSVANAIRVQGGFSATLEFPDGFVSAIQNLSPSPTLQSKSVAFTPAETVQTSSVTADAGYDGLSAVGVTVGAIPSQYVVPSGTYSITSNGTYDVTNYATADVNVSGGGGASSWELITHTTLAVNTTSTSTASVGTIDCGSSAYTSDDVIWVHIRGQRGKQSGYFYGSDAIFANSYKANNTTTTFPAPATENIRVESNGSYSAYTGSYGVWAYSISSSGTLTIRARYSSSQSLTINDTFDIYVYKLSLPSPLKLFE